MEYCGVVSEGLTAVALVNRTTILLAMIGQMLD